VGFYEPGDHPITRLERTILFSLVVLGTIVLCAAAFALIFPELIPGTSPYQSAPISGGASR
jgi:hypothetical protein